MGADVATPASDTGTAARRRTWTRLAIAAVFLAGFAVYLLYGDRYLDSRTFADHRRLLLAYAHDHYWPMLAATAVVYIVTTALSIPGGPLRSLATGFLFGRWAGAAIIVLSATTGATLAFLAARHLFADALRRHIGGRAAALVGGFEAHPFRYLLFLRLVPLFPFWLVNLAPALTRIRVRTFVSATGVGIAPMSFVMASFGSLMISGTLPEDLPSFQAALMASPVGLVAALVGLLILASALVERRSAYKGGRQS